MEDIAVARDITRLPRRGHRAVVQRRQLGRELPRAQRQTCIEFQRPGIDPRRQRPALAVELVADLVVEKHEVAGQHQGQQDEQSQQESPAARLAPARPAPLALKDSRQQRFAPGGLLA